jgi:hypothetical protein
MKPGGARAVGAALLVVVIGCVPVTEAPQVSVPPERSGTVGGEGPPAAEVEEARPAVVLVVLDGARWQDIFRGADPSLAASAHVEAPPAEVLMPHLHELAAQRGAALGAPDQGPAMTASGPHFVSLPGYTEIFTGHRRHPCADNDCPATHQPTVFDEARAAMSDPGEVAVFSSWERIARVATSDESRLVLSTGRSHVAGDDLLRADDLTAQLLDEGRAAGTFPGHGDFRPDRITGPLALRYLETRQPRLMFIGLGEPDEYAHRGDYGAYLDALRAADRVIGDLFATLDRMGARGRQTSVFVTADHGRARDYRFHGGRFPESSRVWMVAAGGGVTSRGWLRSERPHCLADIAPTVRALLGLPPDPLESSGAPLLELFGSPTVEVAGK